MVVEPQALETKTAKSLDTMESSVNNRDGSYLGILGILEQAYALDSSHPNP